MVVTREVSKGRTWEAWSGSISELKRIYDLIDELARERKNAVLGLMPPEPDAADDSWRARDARREREGVEKSFTPIVEASYPDERVEGPYAEVIEQFDPRTYRRLELKVGRYLDKDKLALELRPYQPGVNLPPKMELTLTSADPGWSAAALSRLSAEIDRGVPRWAWMHRIGGLVLMNLLIYATVVITLQLILQHSTHLNAIWVALIAGGAGLAVSLIDSRAGFYTVRSILPPIEIKSAAGTSTGTKAILFLVASVLLPVLLLVIPALMT